MDSAALTILHSVTRLSYAWHLFDDKFSNKSSPNFGIFWKSLLYKNFCGHFWATFVKWTIFKKYGPNPPSWDSHLIPQDGRCRRIHWAMVAPLNGLFLFQLLVALIRELNPPQHTMYLNSIPFRSSCFSISDLVTRNFLSSFVKVCQRHSNEVSQSWFSSP